MNTPEPCASCRHCYNNVLTEDDPNESATCVIPLNAHNWGNPDCPYVESAFKKMPERDSNFEKQMRNSDTNLLVDFEKILEKFGFVEVGRIQDETIYEKKQKQDSIEPLLNCLRNARACLLNLQSDDSTPVDRQMQKMVGEISKVLEPYEEYNLKEKKENHGSL